MIRGSCRCLGMECLPLHYRLPCAPDLILRHATVPELRSGVVTVGVRTRGHKIRRGHTSSTDVTPHSRCMHSPSSTQNGQSLYRSTWQRGQGVGSGDTLDDYEATHLEVSEERSLYKLVKTRKKLFIDTVHSFIITLSGLNRTGQAELRRHHISLQEDGKRRRQHLCTLGIG
jgi:hypothetical protein